MIINNERKFFDCVINKLLICTAKMMQHMMSWLTSFYCTAVVFPEDT